MIAQTLKHMLTFYEEIGNLPKAAQCGEKALQLSEQALGPDHESVSSILVRLGHLYITQKVQSFILIFLYFIVRYINYYDSLCFFSLLFYSLEIQRSEGCFEEGFEDRLNQVWRESSLYSRYYLRIGIALFRQTRRIGNNLSLSSISDHMYIPYVYLLPSLLISFPPPFIEFHKVMVQR